MDSLKVDYWIEDQGHTRHYINYPRQDSLRTGEVLLDTLSISTLGYGGLNGLWITANPRVSGNIQDQEERFYFNNFAERPFTVNEDKTNPILDVTFDGIHILDKDIVSPEPHIVITLDDENKFLLLNEDADTANVQVSLRRPNSATFEPLYYNINGEEQLKWIPASDEKNIFKIEYTPNYKEDGIYTLKVQGKDKSGNFSGDLSYQISFEVINESTITNLFNYPNPFSTKTHFVFTLTGREVPEHLLIQIMTITGKVVKEIDLADQEMLRIGNNKTTYYWDGKDEFGDYLANGVYLYKVTAKLNGENIKHRATTADKAFKKQIGKMYLMR